MLEFFKTDGSGLLQWWLLGGKICGNQTAQSLFWLGLRVFRRRSDAMNFV